MKYNLKTFKNGLRLVTIPLPVKSVTVEVSVDAGSRYETAKNSGISHFSEHMFFKGTKKRPTARDIATEVDGFGGAMNANTGKEGTSFYIKAAAEHLPKVLDILADILTNSKFDPAEVEKEKGVIIEEINMRNDTPIARIDEIFDSLLYSKTSLGREIIGKKETVASLKRQDFMRYLKQFYQPARMVIGIAGAFPSKLSFDWQKLSFSFGIFSDPGSEKTRKRYSFSQSKPQVKLHYKKTEQAHFCLGVRAFKRLHPDRYVLGVLATILGGSMSSRLFEEVREKRGLAYYVHTVASYFHETGHLVTQVGVPIGKIEEAAKVILNEYKKVVKVGQVEKVELAKAKKFLKGHLILSLEESHNVASLFGTSLLLENRVRTPEEIIKGIEKVTVADVQRVAKKIFLQKHLNLAIMGPYREERRFEKILNF